MTNLEFWSSLASSLAWPLVVMSVVLVLRRQLGGLVRRMTSFTALGVSAEMTTSVDVSAQEVAIETLEKHQPEDLSQKGAYEAALASLEGQIREQERMNKILREASAQGQGLVHLRFNDDGTMSVSAMNPPRHNDNITPQRADLNDAVSRALAPQMTNLNKRIARTLADAGIGK